MWNVDNESIKGIPAPPEPPAAAHPPSATYLYDPYPQHDDEPRTILGLTAKEDRNAFIFVMVLLLIVFIGFTVWMSQPRPIDLCNYPQSFSCLDQRVQECVTSEKYTQEQCVILVGGNK